jgi:hypothetical protein
LLRFKKKADDRPPEGAFQWFNLQTQWQLIIIVNSSREMEEMDRRSGQRSATCLPQLHQQRGEMCEPRLSANRAAMVR